MKGVIGKDKLLGRSIDLVSFTHGATTVSDRDRTTTIHYPHTPRVRVCNR